MKNIKDSILKAVARVALSNAKNELNSTCTFIGYQPSMPAKVHELKQKK